MWMDDIQINQEFSFFNGRARKIRSGFIRFTSFVDNNLFISPHMRTDNRNGLKSVDHSDSYHFVGVNVRLEVALSLILILKLTLPFSSVSFLCIPMEQFLSRGIPCIFGL